MLQTYRDELERIEGRDAGSTGGRLTLALEAHCPGGAEVVLERTKDVLRGVVTPRARGGAWPDLGQWRRVLPGWFVDACAPEQTEEQLVAWLKRWRSLSPAEQVAEEQRQAWALADWLHWFAPGPDERQWRWLGARVITPDRLEVTLAVSGLPTAYGAFGWLLRAAGAATIREV
jgi:hypothetical protein